jgi:thiamine kinase-like enzyme
VTGANPDNGAAERALRAVPGMAGATLLGALSDGPTNASFLTECDGQQYVFRLDKPGAAQLGLNRRNEHRVSQVVFASGLAPEPIYSDPGSGVYVRRFQEGRSWTPSDLACPGNLERLARLLRRLHGLSPQGDAFDPIAAARRYAAQLGSGESRELLSQAEGLMGKINAVTYGRVLCHNDLVCQNILEGEPLMLLDWEYAGLGHRFFDLAVVVQHHSLAPALMRGFLASYLGRPATGRELAQLGLQCEFYQCLLQLWNLRVRGI